jgi:hypothetical protein
MLTDDVDLFPIRGQVVIIDGPGLEVAVADESGPD